VDPAFAEAIGAMRPFRLPAFVVHMAAGRYASYLATQLRGASNERRSASSTAHPGWPSWRQGFREALG
jgi:hypothetical protein